MHNSKRGLRVRNSMKGALAELGFHGESKGSTEWSKWAESEKQVLASIMKKFDLNVFLNSSFGPNVKVNSI